MAIDDASAALSGDLRVSIDLNADLGEGAGHDEALLAVVTSANVACGAHAGDPATMRATCAAAAARGVVIGAHPGYPDRVNFGRLPMELSDAGLRATLAEQYAALAAAAAEAGTAVAYVKAHGALYHRAAADPAVAAAVVEEALAAGIGAAGLPLLGPPGGAAAGARLVVEGFADRSYVVGSAGRPELLDRRDPGAVLDHDEALAQALSLATTGLASTTAGASVAVHPRSICVHGDTPGAAALAAELRAALLAAGIELAAFAA